VLGEVPVRTASRDTAPLAALCPVALPPIGQVIAPDCMTTAPGAELADTAEPAKGVNLLRLPDAVDVPILLPATIAISVRTPEAEDAVADCPVKGESKPIAPAAELALTDEPATASVITTVPAPADTVAATPDTRAFRLSTPEADEIAVDEPEATRVAMIEPLAAELAEAEPASGLDFDIVPLAEEEAVAEPATDVTTPSGQKVMTPTSYAVAALMVPENVWVAVVAPTSL
ncbi:MAG TPA: hypothetical protein VNS88_00400, partial [Nitrospiraceae bacterium]|nr:hypothetical protein [Nitrospiraceae bacterium]